MGHRLKAFIGKNYVIDKLADDWSKAAAVKLPQDCSMVYLTDELFDDITELSDIENSLDCRVLIYFTSAIFCLMSSYSFQSQIAYIETDFFGGYGSQAGVMFQNGKSVIGPVSGNGTINQILNALGIWRNYGKDEFDTLGLSKYRN